MILLLFLRGDPETESASSAKQIQMRQTGNTWHIAVLGVPHHAHYSFNVVTCTPHHHNQQFGPPVVDPYAKQLVGRRHWGCRDPRAFARGESRAAVFHEQTPFDWQGDKQPVEFETRPQNYEMPVRGLTASPSSETKAPGTFLGVAEKAAAIAARGFTAVELLPVFEWDERIAPSSHTNYWGLSSQELLDMLDKCLNVCLFQQRSFNLQHKASTLSHVMMASLSEILSHSMESIMK